MTKRIGIVAFCLYFISSFLNINKLVPAIPFDFKKIMRIVYFVCYALAIILCFIGTLANSGNFTVCFYLAVVFCICAALATQPGFLEKSLPMLESRADLYIFGIERIVPGAAQEHGADYALSFEGPLVFFVDGDGARTANLRDGNPLESAEAKTALVSGKKLRSAKINIAQDDRLWTCTVDALDFTFRSLKLPKGNGATPDEIFQDRMEFLQEFLGVFWRLYDTFLSLRANEKKWLKVQKSVQEWVANREAKA